MLHLCDLELDRVRIAVGSEPVDNRPSGIAEREKLGDLVEGFSGGVIASVADLGVGPEILLQFGEVEMRVTSGDDERQDWKLKIRIVALALLEQNGMNVAFQMVDRDQRLIERERQRFGEADADEERSCQTWTLRDGDGVDGIVGLVGFGQGLANNWDNGAQVLARG